MKLFSLCLCITSLLTAFESPDELNLSTPDELFAASNEELFIGGLVDPLTGQLHFKETDLVVKGAQKYELERLYLPTFIQATYDKHEGKDRQKVYEAVNRTYRGFKVLPHLKMNVCRDKKKWWALVPLKSGAVVKLVETSPHQFKLDSDQFIVSNFNGKEVSGKFDLRNMQASYDSISEQFTVQDADGSTRIYKKRNGNVFLLEKEILLNGKAICYRYKEGKLKKIETCDVEERFIYAEIQIDSFNLEFNHIVDLFKGNGLIAEYSYNRELISGSWKKKHEKSSYEFYSPFYMDKITTYFYKDTELQFNDTFSLTKYEGKSLQFQCDLYNRFGESEKTHRNPVKSLAFPVDEDDQYVSLYSMNYRTPILDEREGYTIVQKEDGTRKIYSFNINLLLNSICYFDEKNTLRKKEVFTWDPHHKIKSIQILDEEKKLFLERSFECDSFGNPILEKVTGCDFSYQVKRSFSKDGKHLLLKEEYDSGKVIEYTYLDNTNLPLSETVYSNENLFEKTTYLYDEACNLLEKQYSDGIEEKVTTYFLRQEKPFLHMIDWIEERYGEGRVLHKRIHYSYDRYGNVTSEDYYDGNHNYLFRITKEYDEKGNLLSETNPLQQKAHYSYDNRDRLLLATDFSEKKRTDYCYDLVGRLIEKIETGVDHVVHKETYTYNFDHLLTSRTDTFHQKFSYEYDPFTKKVVKRVGPDLVESQSTYDAFGREISFVDENDNSTYRKFNSYSQPVEISRPDGSLEKMSYTNEGWLKEHLYPDGVKEVYLHNSFGQVTAKMTYKNDLFLYKEQCKYQGHHLLEEIDKDGVITTYSYDSCGREIAKRTLNKCRETSYDARGNVGKTIESKELFTFFEYDLLNRLTKVTKKDIFGKLLYQKSYRYDEASNIKEELFFVGTEEVKKQFLYDSFNRLISQMDPLGHETKKEYFETYDTLFVKTTYPNFNFDLAKYTPYFQIEKMGTFNRGGKLLKEISYRYDGKGNILEKRNADGNDYRVTYTYTALDEIASITENGLRTTLFSYTPFGKIATKTLPDGVQISYSYDENRFLNRLTSSDGTVDLTYNYNLKGHLLEATDLYTKESIQRTVDSFGNVLREEFSTGVTVEKVYDVFDRCTQLKVNDRVIDYVFDPLFLRSIRYNFYTHTFDSYDFSGHLMEETPFASKDKVHYVYDFNSQLLSKNGFSYSYDEMGNLFMKNTIQYRYNDSSELTEETCADYTFSYLYDSLYNRMKKNQEAFEIDALNQLTDLSYDKRGNVLHKEDDHYSYDALNRLTEVNDIPCLYDPLGRRLSKGVTRYIYDGMKEIGSLNEENQIESLLIVGNSDPVAVELNGILYAAQTDGQKNISSLRDLRNGSIYNETYTAFGEKRNCLSPWSYAFKRFDEEFNLYYFGARYYDPVYGRWLTPDPEDFIDSLNLYQYVFNNPLKYRDPDGRFVFALTFPLIVPTVEIIYAAVTAALITTAVSWGTYTAMEYVQAEINTNKKNDEEYPDPLNGEPIGDRWDQPPLPGYEWRGSGPPGSSSGSWHNPDTGESFYPDKNHPSPIEPHWDYTSPEHEHGYRFYPDGRIEQK